MTESVRKDHRATRRRAAILFIVMALLVAACGGDEDGARDVDDPDVDGDTAPDTDAPADTDAPTSLVIAIGDEPSTIDPQAAEDGNERAVTDNIYETLLRRDTETNELVPHLAAELPVQVDETTWEFTLREGITFTNGEPFNAEAAAFSVNRMIDPELNSAQLSFYGDINGAEAVDEYTVHITTEGFDPVVPARMYRLKMMPPGAADTDFGQEAIGTGPYQLVQWDRGRQVVLESNPDYWGDQPSITDVTIRFIDEAGTRVSGLRTGEIHLATLLPPEQAGDAPTVLTRDGIEFPVYRLKNYEGVLEDARVRQAMNYAIDKAAIADELYSGFASIAPCQALTPGHFGYNPDIDPYPYDPDRARELLEEAGYAGEPVQFLGATGRWLKDSEIHEVVMGYLSEVGFNFEVDIRPFSAYLPSFTQTVGEAQPDMGFVSSSNELFDASQVETYYLSTGSLSSYVNEEVEGNFRAARTEGDEAEREALMQEALRMACEDDPVFLFLVNPQDIYGAVDDLEWQPRIDGSLWVPEMSFTS